MRRGSNRACLPGLRAIFYSLEQSRTPKRLTKRTPSFFFTLTSTGSHSIIQLTFYQFIIHGEIDAIFSFFCLKKKSSFCFRLILTNFLNFFNMLFSYECSSFFGHLVVLVGPDIICHYLVTKM